MGIKMTTQNNPQVTQSSTNSEEGEAFEEPFDNHSSLLANRYFTRTLFKDQKTCVFKCQAANKSLSVEREKLCGQIPSLTNSKEWNIKWWLNLQSFLILLGVSDDPKSERNSVTYLFARCVHVRKNPSNEKQLLIQVNEYGRHLYVNRSGYLCFLTISKAARDKKCSASCEHMINDVLPKARVTKDTKTKQYKLDVIKCSVVIHRKISYEDILNGSRWWYKYGREKQTRFLEMDNEAFKEVIAKLANQYFDLNKGYFGIYLRDRAKMIMTDYIDGKSDQLNHTLIMGGIFMVINGQLAISFMDNTNERLPIEVFTSKYHVIPIKEAKKSRPIVILDAVPSLGDTICWQLLIKDSNEPNSVMHAELGVPLLGINCDRFSVKEWKTGLKEVLSDQNKLNYSNYVRLNIERQFPEREDILSAVFQSGETFAYG